ncbi:hypothetical protein SAMD00019534_082220, partial [Acytostelium subglobosum LB1]|uniref:hypothetical protein n=1 Tax=Acytostelium subglobosum LB1 TaxID=1410327 RepID=UPI000644A4D0
MSDEQIRNQLKQMQNFILNEAKDKAEEIKSKASQEFTSEKGRIFQTEKLKIIKEYEKKTKLIEVQKKINLSNELNKARLSVLKVREESLREVIVEAQKKLALVSADKERYHGILRGLIIQGLNKLGEQQVLLVCRQEDIGMVEKAAPEAAAHYKQKTGMTVTITVDKTRFLPAGPSALSKGPTCCGGIILSALEGRIICKNTLDARLEICFDQMTPIVRTTMYGPTESRKFFD